MPTKAERKQIHQLLASYKSRIGTVSQFMKAVLLALGESPALMVHVHSIKSRVKSPQSLRTKLLDKLDKCRKMGKPFTIRQENLSSRITDLAGVRILHLHTRQFAEIDKALKSIFKTERYRVVEGPFARTWDDESREFFENLGVEIEKSKTLYTSVHYVIESDSRAKVICEIQVRTLMEEVWGEVSHAVNYPRETKSVACREQIRALARSTSAATRLVDSIFATVDDLKKPRRR